MATPPKRHLDISRAKYGNSKVPQSPFFDTIMDRYRLIGLTMSDRQFYAHEVQPIDPSITLRAWQTFMKKFRSIVAVKSDRYAEMLADKNMTDVKMQANVGRKLAVIADASLQEAIENPEILMRIPIKDRMNWLFQAMKAQDSRAKTAIRAKQDMREQSLYDEMMNEARYSDETHDVEEEISSDEIPAVAKTAPRRRIHANVVNELEEPEAEDVLETAPAISAKFDPNSL